MLRRIEYIDSAKGVLIIFTIIGHIFLGTFLQTFIYSFHMPAFFIISGLLFNFSHSLQKSFKKFIVSRIYTILVPYIFFEFLGYMIQCLRHGFYENITGFIYNTIMLNLHNSVDWFLIALFIAEILFFFLYRTKKLLFVIAILCFSLSYIIGEKHILWITSAFIMISIGYLGKEIFNRYNRLSIFLSLIITIIVSFLNVRVDINNGIIGNPILFFIGSLTGTYFILNISHNTIFKKISYFGKNSLIVMGTHQLLILILWGFVYHFDMPKTILSICFAVFIICIEIPIIKFCNYAIPSLVGGGGRGNV